MPKEYEYQFEEPSLDTTGMAQLLQDREEKQKRKRVEKTVISPKLLRHKTRYARRPEN